MASSSSSSSSLHGLLGPKLFEGKTRAIYTFNDQPSLICIHHKDSDETSETIFNISTGRRLSNDGGLRFHSQQIRSHASQSSLEHPGRGTSITSITTCVYQILREASIPTFFVASHPQSNMVIAQKCTMIPIVWIIRRLANESYVRRHPNVTLGHRFLPVIVEICSSRHPASRRRSTLSNVDEQVESERENSLEYEEAESDEGISAIYSYEQLVHTHLDLEQLKISSTDLEYMYEVCSTVFDVLEHVWMTKKKCQLIDLKIEFGWTATKEIVVANVYDMDTWHILPSDGQEHSPEENLSWINNCLRDILDLNIHTTATASDSNPAQSDSEENDKQSLSLSISQPSLCSRCIIVCTSLHDIEHGQKLKNILSETYNIPCDVRLCSVHRSSLTVHKLLASYSYEHCRPTVFVAVGTVNNNISMCLASHSPYPVIHCLLTEHDKINSVLDWNSFTTTETPLYTLVFTLLSAAHGVVQILSMHDWKLWAKQRGRRFKKYMEFILADQQLMVAAQTSKGTAGFSMNK